MDNQAPRSMIVIEEPLVSSDVVSILAVAAEALDLNRRRTRTGALHRLSYGKANFWTALQSTVFRPETRASVSLSPSCHVTTCLSLPRRRLLHEPPPLRAVFLSLANVPLHFSAEPCGELSRHFVRKPLLSSAFQEFAATPSCCICGVFERCV